MWRRTCIVLVVYLLTTVLADDSPSPPPTFSCTQFDQYCAYWKKVYTDTEKPTRRQYYFDNCTAISNHNAQPGATHSEKVNEYTDLTEKEFQEKLGLKPIDRVAMIRVGATTSPNDIKVGAVPSSLDYNAQGKVTSIKNQGSCGCCWSFASIAMYESVLLIKGLGGFGLSEEASLQCTSFYADGGRVSDCSGGYFPDPLTFLAKVGSLLRTNYPYISGTHGDSAGYYHTPNICNDSNRIMVGNGTIQLFSGASPAQIKNLLFTQGPVMIGVYANTGWMKYAGGVYSGCPSNSATLINHAVLLYGYDSSGNWLVKNQWGTTWGNNGFITISGTSDCGLSSLLGNIKFSNINADPRVTVPSNLLFTYTPKWENTVKMAFLVLSLLAACLIL